MIYTHYFSHFLYQLGVNFYIISDVEEFFTLIISSKNEIKIIIYYYYEIKKNIKNYQERN